MTPQYSPGQVIEVKGYPFVRTVFNGIECDADGGITEFQDEGWRPGCDSDEGCLFADGTGEMILTIISIYKPGNFKERVFYTRQWRDPDGKQFGKSRRLLVTTKSVFTKLCRGYRHEFELSESE